MFEQIKKLQKKRKILLAAGAFILAVEIILLKLDLLLVLNFIFNFVVIGLMIYSFNIRQTMKHLIKQYYFDKKKSNKNIEIKELKKLERTLFFLFLKSKTEEQFNEYIKKV